MGQDVDKDTFLTNLRDDAKIKDDKSAINRLNRLVDQIANQFETVLQNHEKDFKAAYEGHMTKVKKELEYLRDKAVEAAGKVSNDDNITRLQSQIKWFQREALVLDQILEGQKREVQKLKTSKANTLSDNKFIKSQVKDAMKHNKLLEVAFNKTNRQSEAIRQFLKNNKKFKSKAMAITADDRPKDEVFITSAAGGIQNEVIKEESRGQIGTIERTQYDLEDYKDRMAAELNEDGIRTQKDTQRDGSQHEEEYLANLNIVKSNADKSVQYQIKRAKEEDDEQAGTFGAALPQTQSQLDELSIDSADYQIKEYVQDLFENKGCTKNQAATKILRFFNAYDASRDLNILMLKRRLDQMKKDNQKLRTYQAFDYAEKTDIENLFLDCIEQCKKE